MKKFGTYLLMIGVALLGAALIASCKPPDPPLYPPAPNITGPEYGLYWFGKDDANTLALPGEENPYYDPDRPTIIYVHGWKPNQGYSHRTMVWKFEDDSGQEQAVDLAAAWVDAGWNVGVFDWGPFADEPIVTDAEAKIWTTEGGEGMRWRDREGEYRTDHSVDIPISQLFYGALVQALADFHGPELRIAGHSLGNQVAVGALAKVMDDVEANKLPPEMIPTQVLLLDPYWSPVVQDYLDERKPGTAVREIIKDVLRPRDVLVSWYQSSLMTDGILISDDNPQLRSLVAIYQRMEPDYCPLTDQVCRHEAAWQSYFYSFAFDPPQVCTRPDKDAPCESTGKAAASASTPEERLREMAGLPVFYEQVSAFKDDNSMYTRRTDDDRYERRSLENEKN